MTGNAEPTWTTTVDEDWADRFELAAADQVGASSEDIVGWLTQVHQAVVDSGRPAEALFGDAEQAALDFGASIPVHRRAAHSLDGESPADFAPMVVSSAGVMAFAGGIYLWLTSGSTVTIGNGTLAAVVMAAGFLVVGTGVRLLWTAGRTRLALGIALVGGVLLAGAAVAGELVTLPMAGTTVRTPLIALGGVLLLLLGWRLPSRAASVDERSAHWPADQWFRRLDGVLRGRHKLPRAEAAERVLEARAHWQHSGASHPFDEFGAPETYALELLGDDRGDCYRDRARRRNSLLVSLLFLGYAVVSGLSGDVGAATIAACAIGVYYAWRWRAPLRARAA